jgi:hypothetical protein
MSRFVRLFSLSRPISQNERIGTGLGMGMVGGNIGVRWASDSEFLASYSSDRQAYVNNLGFVTMTAFAIGGAVGFTIGNFPIACATSFVGSFGVQLLKRYQEHMSADAPAENASTE